MGKFWWEENWGIWQIVSYLACALTVAYSPNFSPPKFWYISFVKAVYSYLNNYCFKCIQGGFVGLAKASLKTAEAGKVAKKGEGNLKAPFALIIEVNICMGIVLMMPYLYSLLENWLSRHTIKLNCLRNTYHHQVSGNLSILLRISYSVFLSILLRISYTLLLCTLYSFVYYSGYYAWHVACILQLLVPYIANRSRWKTFTVGW